MITIPYKLFIYNQNVLQQQLLLLLKISDTKVYGCDALHLERHHNYGLKNPLQSTTY